MTAVSLYEFKIVRLAESGIRRDDYFPGPLVIVNADVIVESRAERREFDAEVAGLRRDCLNWRRLWFDNCPRFAVQRSWRCEVPSCDQRQLLRKS